MPVIRDLITMPSSRCEPCSRYLGIVIKSPYHLIVSPSELPYLSSLTACRDLPHYGATPPNPPPPMPGLLTGSPGLDPGET